MSLLTIVLKNLWSQKARTLLTVLGVGISIAAFVSLRGLTDSLEEAIRTTYNGRGTELIAMEKASLDIFASSIEQSYASSLKAIPEIKRIAPSLIYFYAVRPKDYLMLFGWEYDSFLFDGVKITGSPMRAEHDALVGFAAAKRLRKAPGDTILIRGETFTVKGIFESPSLLESGGIIVPLASLQRLKKCEGRVTTISFLLEDQQELKISAYDRRSRLNAFKDRISAMLPELEIKDMQDFASAPFQAVFSFTWAISLVVFLIVVLGIANTMTTSVLERSREIAILSAIGWRRSRIVRLVLLEAVILGTLGGLAGLLLGHGMMQALLTLPEIQGFVQMRYDPGLVMRTLGLAIVVGLAAGFYPAWRAVSIKPVEVLHNE